MFRHHLPASTVGGICHACNTQYIAAKQPHLPLRSGLQCGSRGDRGVCTCRHIHAAEAGRYSGSDIRLVCKEAAMRPVRKIFDTLEADLDDGEPPLCVMCPPRAHCWTAAQAAAGCGDDAGRDGGAGVDQALGAGHAGEVCGLAARV